MHPAEAEGFEWDEGNELELEQSGHPIKPWEAEEVFMNGPQWAANKRAGSGDWKMIGRTHGGRLLTIIVEAKEITRMIRPITGWPTTKGERTRYIKEER